MQAYLQIPIAIGNCGFYIRFELTKLVTSNPQLILFNKVVDQLKPELKMDLQSVTNSLVKSGIFHSDATILDKKTVIGYEKRFKWTWFATQLNTFIIATDIGNEEVTIPMIEKHLTESFKFAEDNYNGWPRGFQSGLGIISILISTKTNDEVEEYCKKLKSGKKWAGFTIPVIYNSEKNEIYKFEKNPAWGMIYYPHFRKLIRNLK